MPNLIAASFEGVVSASFALRCLEPGRRRPDGWGLGWYPGGDRAATVVKDPMPGPGSLRGELVREWGNVASSMFLLHVRHAMWGHVSEANTQPFARSFAGRDWMLAHAGSLDHRLEQRPDARFVPVGNTDSELILCELLGWIASRGFTRFGELDQESLLAWLRELNRHGASSLVVTDGADVVAYADEAGRGELWIHEVLPPAERLAFGDGEVAVEFSRRGELGRKGVLVSAGPLWPLTADGAFADTRCDAGPASRKLAPGAMAVVRLGAIRAELSAAGAVEDGLGASPAGPRVQTRLAALARPTRVRRFDVEHRTTYRYATPVERSTHFLRLEPVHDLLQSRISHEVEISVGGEQFAYEDVFGNRVLKVDISSPYTAMTIASRSRVEVRDVDPLGFHARPQRRSSIPLIWMPWQRHMLQPYLLPPELPETQLRELTDYAMSFVERNDGDLLEMLVDLNLSIFRDYRYVPGVTHLATTPFEVYLSRKGVCQDFANLFICLARLLSIPARYVCGYIYTGPKAQNRAQSEASHAWVQVYLPEVGWRGFDPTNGLVTHTDHIRVAHGRNYVDATPTSGTIFDGGGAETLEVAVSCEPCDEL